MELGKHNQTPLNLSQLFSVHVVVLRWQQFRFFGHCLCPTNLAPVDSGIWCSIDSFAPGGSAGAACIGQSGH
jgi:hypothetical protein